MNKNNFPIYLSLATVLGILIGTFFNGGSSGLSLTGSSKNEAKIKRLMDYIERDYVDDVNTDILLDDAITQMLGKLDPHSVYIPKENLQAVQEKLDQAENTTLQVQAAYDAYQNRTQQELAELRTRLHPHRR